MLSLSLYQSETQRIIMKSNFKSALSAILLMTLVGCSSNEKSKADYGIIPLPQSIRVQEGTSFVLDKSTTIIYPKGNEDLKRVAQFLSDYIHYATDKTLAISDEEKTNNVIILKSELDNKNTEAYNLKVSENAIIINGASNAGVFYGIQTLRKSIDTDTKGKDIEFPLADIEDYPRFGYRGMHLDVSRHMFPVAFIKEYIDILALHNMNKFHWHLTDDQGWRIEIKKYPELTEKGSIRKQTRVGLYNSGEFDGKPYGGFYTQEEARYIVKYAQDRFITIIPEIDLPGHMLAALHAYPKLGCTGGPYEVAQTWGIFDDVLCAGNKDVYPFLEDIFTEIIDIFPSEYIHLGGDECPKVRWEKCKKCQAKIKELNITADDKHSAEDKLQSYMITYMEKFLNSKGRKVIGWDEILEGGLAPNATVMSWRGMEGAAEAAKEGNDAVMVSKSHLYFDYYQTKDHATAPLAIGGYVPLEKVYDFNPIPKGLTEEEAKHIIGVQANLWTEYIPTTQQVEYMLMPRIDALSEVQWTMPEHKNYDNFLQRLYRMLAFYDSKGFNYSKTLFDIQDATKNSAGQNAMVLTLSTVDNAPIHYTTDGTDPTEQSPLWTDSLHIAQTTDIKAVATRNGKVDGNVFSKKYEYQLPVNAVE